MICMTMAAASDSTTWILKDQDVSRTSMSSLRINKQYASRLESEKNKEELRELKKKYAKKGHILSDSQKDLDEEALEEESTSSEEDSDAELLTKEVNAKILATISRIQHKDPSIYDSHRVFFNEEDFNPENGSHARVSDSATSRSGALPQSSSRRPLTFTNFMSETLKTEGAAAFVEEEERLEAEGKRLKSASRQSPLSYEQEQKALKAALLQAADAAENDEGDGFLQVHTKTNEELQAEQLSFQEFLKKRATSRQNDDAPFLERYFQNDDALDDGEQFLRNYVLFEGWKEGNKMPQGDRGPEPKTGDLEEVDSQAIDLMDEATLDTSAQFEAAYNFRFEEKGVPTIEGHARKILNSVRQKDEKRRQKRLERQKRKEKEKEAKRAELERLKILKRQDILNRLRTIQKIAGIQQELDPTALNLDGEFNEQAHEQEMQRLFGEDFEKGDELEPQDIECVPQEIIELVPDLEESNLSNRQKKKLERLRKKQEKLARKQAMDDGEAYAPILDEDKDVAAPVAETKEEGSGPLIDDVSNHENADAIVSQESREAEPLSDDHLWFLCDRCHFGIPAGKRRYECDTCEDFVLCRRCFRDAKHPHHMTRFTVPDDCHPPPEYLHGQSARDVGQPETPSEPKKQAPNTTAGEQRALIDKILDEYHALDYEDIIAGMPVRFKYTQVTPDNFGLTTEEILTKPDAELNSIVSLKKLAPYRKDQKALSAASKRKAAARRYQLNLHKKKRDENAPHTPSTHATTENQRDFTSYTAQGTSSERERTRRLNKRPTAAPHFSEKRKKQPQYLVISKNTVPENVSSDRLKAYGLSTQN